MNVMDGRGRGMTPFYTDCKVLVIGELGVGKTSIIKRYVHQLFSQHYRATIGVDFALKVLNWDSRTLVRLQLWDIAANKCDQKRDGGQNPPQMDQFCKEHGFTGWFETSAKDNINIDEAARFLVENILANHQNFPNEENDVGKIKLHQETLRAESKSQCC
ncbi:Ras-related protein Rab-32 [Tupaia chinensis]|uniref:Ras-related protein Rab-32 n=1 Tax=Tupaia chinensis TaxID=246437 RepID=L9LDW3_TUPCH|nr:Ras-related protein Rab-32 [Tupaia chinensis]